MPIDLAAALARHTATLKGRPPGLPGTARPRTSVPGQAPGTPPSGTGPYQGGAGSEYQNPGRQRVPLPSWADPSSPDYERRNYYQLPNGQIIAREPGYYNPDNPYDTGREGERNKEYLAKFGEFKSEYERRMDEPGVEQWGPGDLPSEPGEFDAPGPGSSPGGAPGAGRQPGLSAQRSLAQALLTPQRGLAQGLRDPAAGLDARAYLNQVLSALIGKTRGGGPAGLR